MPSPEARYAALNPTGVSTRPKIYLAHASEDKLQVRPVAEYLISHGVDVWFDEWEIEPGDSLRLKMEEGLGAMTHFVVILTPISITRPWVEREIDVGFVGLVGGKNKMIPLRVGVEVSDLPPFLQTLFCEKLDPTNPTELAGLVGRLYGVSQKPTLGPTPHYAQPTNTTVSGWSAAAAAIIKNFVESSVEAMPRDPVKTIDDLARETGLPVTDVRIAVLDLKERGYIWESAIKDQVAPNGDLFAEFDELFMSFSPTNDARTVANQMASHQSSVVQTQALATELGWAPRRMNSAICFLRKYGVIETRHALASRPWQAVQLICTDKTIRFAHDAA